MRIHILLIRNHTTTEERYKYICTNLQKIVLSIADMCFELKSLVVVKTEVKTQENMTKGY